MGEQQEIETLINEEALLFAQFLRNEREAWIPGTANLNSYSEKLKEYLLCSLPLKAGRHERT